MDEFVEQVAQARDSAEMAARMAEADPAAREYLETSALEYWDKPGLDRKAASDFVLRIATGFALCKDYPRAFHLATAVADSALEAGDKEMLSPALGTLGVILLESGLTVEARRIFEKILTLTDETGDAHSRARALHNLGLIEAMEGRDIRAVGCFEDALETARTSADGEVAEASGRLLDLAREAPLPTRPAAGAEPALRRCPECVGKGLVHKEDYGVVLCPMCKGACQV